ncbi:hypothetical protein [Clostridium sp. DL1XJH146]
MAGRRKLKSMELIEVLLIFLAVILLMTSLILVGKKLESNTTIYNILMVSVIFISIFVISIVIFLFVKRKFIDALKFDLEEEIDTYKSKLEEKVLITNNRIFGFETNYSKKLKKIMKDYNIKVKEIENIKKELNIKLIEEDRKLSYLEIEINKMKLHNLLSEEDYSEEERDAICSRIMILNELYPGINDEKLLSEVGAIINNK